VRDAAETSRGIAPLERVATKTRRAGAALPGAVAETLHSIPHPQEELRGLPHLLLVREREIEGIGEAVDDVEGHADVDGVLDLLFPEPVIAEDLHVLGRDVVGCRRELLDEQEDLAETVADRRGPPVPDDGLGELRISDRRDRGV
jgi:hypothetical protein